MNNHLISNLYKSSSSIPSGIAAGHTTDFVQIVSAAFSRGAQYASLSFDKDFIDSVYADLVLVRDYGTSLKIQSQELQIPARLDFSKVKTAISRWSDSGIIVNDGRDYRIHYLRWRSRTTTSQLSYADLLPVLASASPAQQEVAFRLELQANLYNTAEQTLRMLIVNAKKHNSAVLETRRIHSSLNA